MRDRPCRWHGSFGGKMLTDTLHYGLLIALAIALGVAALTDVRRRQIDNWLTGAIALAAPLFWWANPEIQWIDVAWQVGFALMAAMVLIGIYALGHAMGVVILGGGDIKLLGALALWLPPLLFANLLIIMGAVGGIMAVGFGVRRGVFKPKTPGVLPYGVAIAAGGLWVLAFNLLPAANAAAASV